MPKLFKAPRKSIQIAPRVKVNLSKSGVSTSVGGKGSTVNIGNVNNG